MRDAKLTHKRTGLKDLFYALVKARTPNPAALPDSARARAAKQHQDLARVRAERDDLRGQAQLLARIVHVLEIENSQLKETNAALAQQMAAQTGVPDVTRWRRSCDLRAIGGRGARPTWSSAAEGTALDGDEKVNSDQGG
nr:hypothetical protein StreXyl84_80300 [Streptomyces sp. Xyl84]